MSEKNRKKNRNQKVDITPVADPRTATPTPPTTKKPLRRERKEYHNRANTFLGHVDQVMNPGKIYRDPGAGPSIGRDRVVPALSEVALAGKRLVEDKMNAGKMKDGGPTKRKKSIDGIAQRGKTRAK